MSLYENLEVKPCNILGFLHFEVCNGNITLGAFAYEKDAVLFKEAAQQSGQANGEICPACGDTLFNKICPNLNCDWEPPSH